jgi:(p)ppGpp synthase/HD superfamily hydrolase
MIKNEVSARDGWRRLAKAIEFALEIHAQQKRKGTDTPYVSHLLGVTSLVLEHGGDEEQAIAAMLHDAVEDQGAHLEPVIRNRFGARVADIVVGCTDADTLPKPPWRQRKETYIRHLEHADLEVLLVSCADKVHNARAICTDVRTHGRDVFRRFKAGQDGTLWYYRTLADAFQRLMPGPLSDELSGAAAIMERLAQGPQRPTRPALFEAP